MKNTAKFHIIYDGPALSENEMDVKDLAPSLIALSELFEEANLILNKGRTNISLNVKATFKTGCFGIDLHIIQSKINSILDYCKGENIVAAGTLLGFIGLNVAQGASIGVKGLIQLIKWVRGRKIKTIEILDNGTVKIIIDDDCFETEKQVLDLYKSYKIREALYNAISKPLEKDGIDSFACTDEIDNKVKFIVIRANCKTSIHVGI